MNILFDFNHPADVNFFKNAAKKLAAAGDHIFITYRQRGSLQKVIDAELGEFSPFQIGRHRSASFLMKVLTQIYRDYRFLSYFKKNGIELSVGTSTNVISARLMGIPHLAFEDDLEYKVTFYHANLFATRHIMPSYINVQKKNIYHYRGLKELAHLHPSYYSPQVSALDPYKVQPEEYVFIRKIARVSLNYKREDDLGPAVIKSIRKHGLKILLSLEDKRQRDLYQDDCTILEEPVPDIFALMKFAAFCISSGDSMARESCLLGTPTIYAGRREMKVNEELIGIGCLFKEDTEETIRNRVSYLISHPLKGRVADLIARKIEHDWEDVTQVIIRHVDDFRGPRR
jgi:predicted glycosyltransferase